MSLCSTGVHNGVHHGIGVTAAKEEAFFETIDKIGHEHDFGNDAWNSRALSYFLNVWIS